MNFDALLLQAIGQRLDQVLVGARHQLVHELDHGDLGTQRAVHGGHFQADDAAADDQQGLGHFRQFQRVGGIHHALVFPREVRQLHRLRTGRDDALLEAQQLGLAVVAGDFQLVGRDELGHALHGADLALLGHAGQALGQLTDDLFLVLAQLVQADLRRAVLDAQVTGVRGVVDDLGGMQQRLGRNAAHVEADAAEVGVAFDEHGVHAQVGRTERGGVAARAGAQHHQTALDVGLATAGRQRLGSDGRVRRAVRRGHRRLAARCGLAGRGSRSGAFGFQDHHHVAFRQLVVELDLDFLDHASGRGRHLQRRLVRFQRDQALILLHRVAHRDQDFDHRHIVVITNVRNLDFNRRHCFLPWAQPASSPENRLCILSSARSIAS
ncbi:hypothetical protein D3C81_1210380 [compost metagenome]